MLNQGSNKLIQRTIYIILKELTEYNTEYMESTLTKCPTICSVLSYAVSYDDVARGECFVLMNPTSKFISVSSVSSSYSVVPSLLALEGSRLRKV